MRKIVVTILGAAALCAPSANAQVLINMSRITCGEYVAMAPDASAYFSAWMSGWFNQKSGFKTVDLDAYAQNIANVKQWCASNPKETVMAGLQRATGRR